MAFLLGDSNGMVLGNDDYTPSASIVVDSVTPEVIRPGDLVTVSFSGATAPVALEIASGAITVESQGVGTASFIAPDLSTFGTRVRRFGAPIALTVSDADSSGTREFVISAPLTHDFKEVLEIHPSGFYANDVGAYVGCFGIIYEHSGDPAGVMDASVGLASTTGMTEFRYALFDVNNSVWTDYFSAIVGAPVPVSEIALEIDYTPGADQAVLNALVTGTPTGSVEFDALTNGNWIMIGTGSSSPYQIIIPVSGENGDQFSYRARVDGFTSGVVILEISGQVDLVGPVPTLHPLGTGTRLEPFYVAIAFDEDILEPTIALADFDVTNCTLSDLQIDLSVLGWGFVVTPVADAVGTGTLQYRAGSVSDNDGNPNSASAIYSFQFDTRNLDRTPDLFSVPVKHHAIPGQWVEFEVIDVQGLDEGVDVPVVVSNAQYRVSTDGGATYGADTSAQTDVQVGYKIIARIVAAGYGLSAIGSISIGGVVSELRAVSLQQNPITIGAVIDPDSGYAGFDFEYLLPAGAFNVVDPAAYSLRGVGGQVLPDGLVFEYPYLRYPSPAVGEYQVELLVTSTAGVTNSQHFRIIIVEPALLTATVELVAKSGVPAAGVPVEWFLFFSFAQKAIGSGNGTTDVSGRLTVSAYDAVLEGGTYGPFLVVNSTADVDLVNAYRVNFS